MIYLITGEEKYLVQEKINALKLDTQDDSSLMQSSFFGSEERLFCECPTLFGGDKVLILRGKFNDVVSEMLFDYEGLTIVIVPLDEPDKRTKAYKHLMALKPKMIHCSKLRMDELKAFILERVKMQDDVLELFITRSGYMFSEDVNLYNLIGYMNSLSCVSSITKSVVEDLVDESLDSSVFTLINYIMAGDVANSFKLLEVQTKDAMRLLALLIRNFRLAYKASIGFTASDLGLNQWVYSKINVKKGVDYMSVMDLCLRACADVKLGANKEDTLKLLLIKIFQGGMVYGN